MTRGRRMIAEAVRRLRSYLEIGGQPYIRADGILTISLRAPTMWGKGDAAQRAAVEKCNNLFLDALGHDFARHCIARAIRVAGKRRPNGAIVIGSLS